MLLVLILAACGQPVRLRAAVAHLPPMTLSTMPVM